ncbi:MAG: DNRLRE domain-containing protein [candidate division WOR-3 bacterium]|nr:DNRLRE domain-containing protein [candidate division WOR-3 bacterium]
MTILCRTITKKGKDQIFFILTFFSLFLFSCNKNPLGYDELERNISNPVSFEFNPVSRYCYGKYIPLGNADLLVLGRNSEYESRILIQFPLTESLIRNVSSAKLYLYPKRHKNINFSIYPISKQTEWKENYATWKQSDENNTPWNGGYFYPTVLANGTLTSDSCIIELNRNLLDTLVNHSYGFIIIPDTNTNDFATIYSRHTSKSPKLVLNYSNSTTRLTPSQDCHIIDTLNLSITYVDQWVGSGFPFRTLLRFALDTIPNNVTITTAELILNIDQKYALSDTFEVGVWRILEPVTPSNFKNAKFSSTHSAKKTFVITNDSIKIDIRPLVQQWATKPDSNFGCLISILPEHFEIARLQLKVDTTYGPRLKVGYIEPPQGRF